MSDAYKTIARLRADRQALRENLAHIHRELAVSREWSRRWKNAYKAEHETWSEAIDFAQKFKLSDL